MTASETAAMVADLNEEVFRLVRLRLTPMASEIETLLEQVDESAMKFATEQRSYVASIEGFVKNFIVVFSIGAIFLGIGIVVLPLRTIASPLRASTAGMHQLAQGDFSVILPRLDRKDEIGDIAQAVETFKVKSAEKARAEAQANADRELQEAAERAERDRIAAEEARRAGARGGRGARRALAKVMNDFDAAVGGIAKAAMAGDFSQRVPLEGKEGVIRNLAETMNVMCDNIGQVLDDLVGMLGAMADGDLTQRIDADYQGTFAILKDSGQRHG